MKGLVQEGEEIIKEEMEDDVLHDAAIIGAAQKVEHYEIAAYGTVRTFAQMLGKEDVAELLEQTLEEEKEADRKLTEISESLLHEMAEDESEEIESTEEPGKTESVRHRRSSR